MRIIKEADIRKNEILDAAGILFTEKGYENTSVTDIMNAVGIAKGIPLPSLQIQRRYFECAD